jgi:hypothetical protein
MKHELNAVQEAAAGGSNTTHSGGMPEESLEPSSGDVSYGT